MKLGEDLFVGEPLYRVRPSSLEHDYLQYNLTKVPPGSKVKVGFQSRGFNSV